MTKKKSERPLPRVQWNQEQRVFTLEKVPVLELSLSWPQVTDGSRGGERISRYYRRLAGAWRSRWERETYWRACLDLVRCREASRPFRPWSARLEGEVLWQDENTLSLRMDAWEVRGDGRPLQVRTGDLWKLPEGVPLPLRSCFSGKRRWWSRLTQRLIEQGEARRAAGDCFLDADFGTRLRRCLSPNRCCRTSEGLEFYIPQCALAPAAEGVVTLSVSLDIGNIYKKMP